MVKALMISTKIVTLDLFKIKMFFTISAHDVTKNLSRDSNYIADVVK